MSTEKPLPKMLRPDGAVGVGLVERRLEALDAQRELAPHVQEYLGGADGVGADERALDDLVRVALDQGVVLEGGRFALVPVDREVHRLGLAQHAPLAAGLEAGAAPAEDVGRVHPVVDLLGRHGQRGPQAPGSRRRPGRTRASTSAAFRAGG